MINPILTLNKVTKEYKLNSGFLSSKTILVLDHVSLDIFPGEILLLVGRSGAGKSTIAKLLVGVIRPTSGDVVFEGQKLDNKRFVQSIAGQRQIVFQNPYRSLSPRLTVVETIAEPAQIIGMSVSVPDLLDKVGLPRRLIDHLPAQLSAGERQRVALARALSTNPKLLVLDEPTSSLDPIAALGVNSIVEEIRADQAIVVVSHDLRMRHVADRVIEIEAGKTLVMDSRTIIGSQHVSGISDQ